jgi:NAD(P)-dependent dehydrogenase (short-subunit alcohol dehydrogenase family)
VNRTVYITPRAVPIGPNVTAAQGDAADLDDLDRLYDTVRRETGSIDVLWASAGMGEQECRHAGKRTEPPRFARYR